MGLGLREYVVIDANQRVTPLVIEGGRYSGRHDRVIVHNGVNGPVSEQRRRDLRGLAEWIRAEPAARRKPL